MIATPSRYQVRPSWIAGFAHSAGESMFPSLWRGKMLHLVPALGNTGEQLVDVSGHRNFSTMTGFTPATDWGLGVMGPELNFNGSSALIDMGVNPTLLRPDSMSFVALVKPGGGDEFLVHNGAVPLGYDLYITSGGLPRIELDTVDQGVANASGPSSVVTGEYHQLGISYSAVDGANDLWVDGKSVASIAGLTGALDYNAVEELYISRAVDGAVRWFTGPAAEFRIYNRPLTASEFRILYEIPYADLIPRPHVAGKVPVAIPIAEIMTARQIGGLQPIQIPTSVVPY